MGNWWKKLLEEELLPRGAGAPGVPQAPSVPQEFSSSDPRTNAIGRQIIAPHVDPEDSGTDEDTPPKKSSFMDKILPLLFSVGLPTIAGAAMGKADPFMSPGLGAIMGASAGGMGYMGAEQQRKLAEAAEAAKQARADLDYTGRIDAANIGFEGKKYGVDKGLEGTKYTADQGYKGKVDTANIGFEGKKYGVDKGLEGTKYRADQGYKGKVDAANVTAGGKAPKVDLSAQDKTYRTIYRAVGNRVLDPNNKEDRNLFRDVARSVGADKKDELGTDMFITDSDTSRMMKTFNGLVQSGVFKDRVQASPSSTGGKKLNPANPQDLIIMTQFKKQAKGDSALAEQLATQAGYSF